MMDFKLNVKSGDLEISTLDVGLVDGADRVRQQLYVKLNLWVSEWFLDMDFGTPWLQSILDNKMVTVEAAKSAIIQSAIEVADVTRIIDIAFDYDRKTRRLHMSLEAETNFGIVEVRGVYGNS